MEVQMRDAISTRLEAGSPSLMPRLLTALLLCGALLPAVAAPASACGLNWADPAVVWTPTAKGPKTFPLTGGGCPAGAKVTITVTATASGSFQLFTPVEDCASASDCPLSNGFGASHDLAVDFDPDKDQGTSPIIITATFSSPLTNVVLEISDIDFGEGTGTERLDEVIVDSNAGAPLLEFKLTSSSHTFSISGNKAKGNCNPSPFPKCTPATDTTSATSTGLDPDAGTVVAKFGTKSVTTVTITYNEVGGLSNPGQRGIGILANLTALTATPVELTGFTIE